MKKIITFVLCMIMILSCVVVTAAALDTEAESSEPSALATGGIGSVVKTYPNYSKKAISFSFDDGDREKDAIIIASLNKYGLKATFNLQSNKITDSNISEFISTYEGHEVGTHTHSHPDMRADGYTLESAKTEFDTAQEILTDVAGTAPMGGAWPHNTPSAQGFYSELREYLNSIGIYYMRSVATNNEFTLPSTSERWLSWGMTCHQNYMIGLTEYFVELDVADDELAAFTIWGHAYEMATDSGNNLTYEMLDTAFAPFADSDEYWAATNGELYTYKCAMDSSVIDLDATTIYNPSETDLYFIVSGEKVMVSAGTTVSIEEQLSHEHIYDRETVGSTYLVTDGATCADKAVYYKSCICGEYESGESASTFEGPALNPETHSGTVTEEAVSYGTVRKCSTCGEIFETVTAYGTIPGEYDTQTYPFAIFSDGNFLAACKYYTTSSDGNAYVLSWLLSNTGTYSGKEIQILLRRDYAASLLVEDVNEAYWRDYKYSKVTIDLGGNTYDNHGLNPIIWLRYNSTSSNSSVLNIDVINGTLDQTGTQKYGLLFYIGANASNKGPGAHKGLNIYVSDVTFKARNIATGGVSMGWFASAINTAAFTDYPVSIVFNNCEMDTQDGATASINYGTEENAQYMDLSISCTHYDGDADCICDFCGDIFLRSDTLTVIGSLIHGFAGATAGDIKTLCGIPEAVTVSITDSSGNTVSDDTLLESGMTLTVTSGEKTASYTLGTADFCDGINHIYDQKIADKTYLKSEADCQSAAVYYMSCSCGACGTETFTVGDPDPDNHAGALADGVYECCGAALLGTVTEYGTISAEYEDASVYPWALFSEGEFLGAFKYYISTTGGAYKNYSDGDTIDHVIFYLYKNKDALAGKEIQVLLRRDYTAQNNNTDKVDNAVGKSMWEEFAFGKMTFDLGGYTFNETSLGPIVRLFLNGNGTNESTLDVYVKNGTLKCSHKYGPLLYLGANNSGPGAHLGINITAENVHFITTSTASDAATMGWLGNTVKAAAFDNYTVNITFKNCTTTSTSLTWNEGTGDPYINLNVTCDHHDDDADLSCDFCGEMMITLSSDTFTVDGFVINGFAGHTVADLKTLCTVPEAITLTVTDKDGNVLAEDALLENGMTVVLTEDEASVIYTLGTADFTYGLDYQSADLTTKGYYTTGDFSATLTVNKSYIGATLTLTITQNGMTETQSITVAKGDADKLISASLNIENAVGTLTITLTSGDTVLEEITLEALVCDGINHIYDQEIVSDEYLKSNANCTSAAVYYVSCACGEYDPLTAPTFTSGEIDSKNHSGELADNVYTCCGKSIAHLVTPYGTISEEFESEITFPWALFVDGEFISAFRYYINECSNVGYYYTYQDGDPINHVIFWLYKHKDEYAGKDMQILLRRDYTISSSVDKVNNVVGASMWEELAYGELTFDLGGYTLCNDGVTPLVRMFLNGEGKNAAALNIHLMNGTLDQTANHKYGLLLYIGANNAGPGQHLGVNITATNITFHAANISPGGTTMGWFANALNSKAFEAYPINITFNNCKMDTSNGGSSELTWNDETNGKYTDFTLICNHGDSDGDSVCDLCGISFIKINGYSATLGENIGINFYVELPSNVVSVTITVAGNVQTIKLSELTPDGNGVYKLTSRVSSINMREDITIVFLNAEGDALSFISSSGIGKSFTTSVFDYANALIADEEQSDEVKSIAKALLNYGAYAEAHFGKVYEGERAYDEAVMALVTADGVSVLGTVNADGDKSVLGNVQLVLDNATSIRIFINASEITVSGIDSAKLTVGVGFIEIENIDAASLDTVYSFTVNGANVQISALGVAAYVSASDTSDENLVNLMKALYLYSLAAEDYVNSIQ